MHNQPQNFFAADVAKELQDYKLALDASAIVAITDQKGIITYVNDKFCEISQYSRDELVGQDHRILNSGYHTREYIRDLWRTLAGGHIWRGEFRNRAKDGSHYWVDATIVPFLNTKGKPYQYLAIRNDITRKKEQQEKLRLMDDRIRQQKMREQQRLAKAVVQAQEQERNRLGRELHDNINQILVSARLYLGMITEGMPATADTVKLATQLVDKTIREIRELSARQVAPVKDVHLEELIATILQQMKANRGLTTKFTYQVDEPIADDNLKLNVYRIMQEQLNNILKHADASRVSVQIKIKENRLFIRVADDGKGFNTSLKRKGIGISNIENRVKLFNGKMKIDSSPGKGCRILIAIPVL